MGCYYCGCSFNHDDPMSDYYPTWDHKLPRSRGGSNGRDNLVRCCHRCNQEKGNMTVAEFREYLAVTKDIPHSVMRRLAWQRHKNKAT